MIHLHNTMKANKGEHEFIIYYYLKKDDKQPVAYMEVYAPTQDHIEQYYMGRYIEPITPFYQIIPSGKIY